MNGILAVDEDSSNPGIKDVKPIAILEDYISIAKPEKNGLVYLSTIKFCEEVFISETKPELPENIPDIFNLKSDAYRAQVNRDFKLAEKLWIRVLEMNVDGDAVQALKQIAIDEFRPWFFTRVKSDEF